MSRLIHASKDVNAVLDIDSDGRPVFRFRSRKPVFLRLKINGGTDLKCVFEFEVNCFATGMEGIWFSIRNTSAYAYASYTMIGCTRYTAEDDKILILCRTMCRHLVQHGEW